MISTWQWTWAVVAFVSEIAALAALALWGFTTPSATASRVLLGIGVPLAAAVLWGLVAAPRAPVRSTAPTVATKLVVFGAAVLALTDTGHPVLAVALAVAALLGSLLSGAPAGVSSSSRS